MNYAIIGCGRISKKHLLAAKQNNYNIVAICDISKNARKEAIEIIGEKYIVNEYNDFLEMINNENIDIVAIATPSGLHYSIALECLKNNINVIIEKPVTMSLYEVSHLIDVANDKKLEAFVCHQKRYNDAIRFTKSLLDCGELGDVLHIVVNVLWNRNESYYKQANWRGTWTNDGGVLMNQGIHSIDIMNWFAQGNAIETISMYGNLNHPYIECEDFISASIKYDNGVIGNVLATSNINPKSFEESICVCGTNGFVKISGKSLSTIQCVQINNKNIEIEESLKSDNNDIYGYGHKVLYKNIKDYFYKKNDNIISLIDGKKALELVLGIYKSANEKTTAYFPLDDYLLSKNMFDFSDKRIV